MKLRNYSISYFKFASEGSWIIKMESVRILEAPIKSEGDKKEYRIIQLPNGLKAVLIKALDTSAETENLAAASLVVGVGSFDEPENVLGLAHFFEHMLFMVIN